MDFIISFIIRKHTLKSAGRCCCSLHHQAWIRSQSLFSNILQILWCDWTTWAEYDQSQSWSSKKTRICTRNAEKNNLRLSWYRFFYAIMLPKLVSLSSCWSNFTSAEGSLVPLRLSKMQQKANYVVWLWNLSITLVSIQFFWLPHRYIPPNWVWNRARMRWPEQDRPWPHWPFLLSFLLIPLLAKLNTKHDLTWWHLSRFRVVNQSPYFKYNCDFYLHVSVVWWGIDTVPRATTLFSNFGFMVTKHSNNHQTHSHFTFS